MKATNRFAKGSGAYKCRCCGRGTRSTGRGDNENVLMCVECWELAGYENAVSDCGAESLSDADKAEIKRMVSKVIEKGGVNKFDGLLKDAGVVL